jgi:hypothetical protein
MLQVAIGCFTVVSVLLSQPLDFDTNKQVSIETIKTELDLARQLAPVKNKGSLISYMRFDTEYPLHKLSKQDRKRFIDGLTFNEKGLTGFSYEVLRDRLTPTEIYYVLYPMGHQHLAPMVGSANLDTSSDILLNGSGGANSFCGGLCHPGTDYDDMYCADRATCRHETNAVCTHNC